MASDSRRALILSEHVIVCPITAPATRELSNYQDHTGVKIHPRLAFKIKTASAGRQTPLDISF